MAGAGRNLWPVVLPVWAAVVLCAEWRGDAGGGSKTVFAGGTTPPPRGAPVLSPVWVEQTETVA